MLRIVPKEESEFNEKVRRLVIDFAADEGLSSHAVNDSETISHCSDTIASMLWWIKNNVTPSETDLMNTREKREAYMKEYAEKEAKGLVTTHCQCGFSSNNKEEYLAHDCNWMKIQKLQAEIQRLYDEVHP